MFGKYDQGWAIAADSPNKDAAVAYADKYGIDAIVHEPPPRRLKLQAYADNFR